MYKSLFDNADLVLGNGHTVVITGWSKAEMVAAKLDKNFYAAVGNFYSASTGMNYLIRNLLYNPQIRTLAALNATKQDCNSGSVQCLLDFFKNGVRKGFSATGSECWIVNSDIVGYLDLCIPVEEIERLRSYVFIHVVDSIQELNSCVKNLSKSKSYGFIAKESKIYPLIEPETKILPASSRNHVVAAQTIAEAWVEIIYRIRTFGKLRLTQRADKWQQLVDLMVTIESEPEEFDFPDYLPFDRAFLSEYINQMLYPDRAAESELVKYTYGSRLRSWFGVDQIEALIQKIIKEPRSASMVLSLWDAEKDLVMGNSPCLNHIKFYIDEDGRLNLTATIRSNEMYAAWLANAMQLKALQRYVISEVNNLSDLDLIEGVLTTISQSAHIYEHSWGKSDELIKARYLDTEKPQTYSDRVGSFIIAVDRKANKIVVEHVHPNGELIQSFECRRAQEMGRKIMKCLPSIQADHTYYLGVELQKAEIALEHGLLYKQDNPLKIVF